jgi:hypothetical protein
VTTGGASSGDPFDGYLLGSTRNRGIAPPKLPL